MTFGKLKGVGNEKGPTVEELGRDEPGVEEWLDSRGTTHEQSLRSYRQMIGMIRRRSPKPLLELSSDEARVLAQEIKRMGSAQILCGHLRGFFTFHERADLAKHFKVKPKSIAIGADAIPTDAQVNALIANAATARDRALIAALFECGARIGELLAVRLKDVSVVDSPQNGGKKLVRIWFRKSKVQGEQHQFTLVDSAPLVLKWLEPYPLPRQDGEAPLFPSSSPTNYGGVMDRSAAAQILKATARKAGVDPAMIHPHVGRHYAATRMLRNGMTDSMVKRSLGWSPSSRMLARYSHVVAQDAEDAYLRARGLEVGPTSRPEGFKIPTSEVIPMPEEPSHQYVDLKDPTVMDGLVDLLRGRIARDPKILEGISLWNKLSEEEKARYRTAEMEKDKA